jgi:hypothetical protein
MTKQIIYFTALILGLSSCTVSYISYSGNNSKETINAKGPIGQVNKTVEPYHKLKLIGSIDVVLVESEDNNITVKGPENLLDFITVTVKDEVLSVQLNPDYSYRIKGRKNIVLVEVPAKNLSEIELLGSGDISGSALIVNDNVKLTLVGSGDLKANVEAKTLEVSLSGSGDINVKGSAQEASFNLIGFGDISAKQLIAKTINIKLSGSGDIVYNAQDADVTVSLSGSGDVVGKGTANSMQSSKSGFGDIKGKMK